jgi:hypothetical protein
VEVVLDLFTIGIAAVDAAIADHGLTPNLAGGPVEIVLWTDDTDRDYARLTAEGTPSLGAPHDFVSDLRLAWVADPDGNPIQRHRSARATATPSRRALHVHRSAAPMEHPGDRLPRFDLVLRSTRGAVQDSRSAWRDGICAVRVQPGSLRTWTLAKRGNRVDRGAAEAELEVKVRPGREPARTDAAHGCPPGDALAAPDSDRR